ncbi:MAG: hypothetical protein AAFN07_11790 [Pseudomonadota bacterium]
MQKQITWVAAVLGLVVACSTGPASRSSALGVSESLEELEPTTTQPAFVVLSERRLDADGAGQGEDAYDLIRAFGGKRSIEAPDLYSINHPGSAHIYEDSDSEVGPHFVFVIHRDDDMDRDRRDKSDRQRNEIKTYRSSEDAVKGFEGETLVFRWRFKVEQGMTVSRRFTHLFQLKAVGGDDSQPILTISGAKRRGEDGIEIRHSSPPEGQILERSNWSEIEGEWLTAYCRATFSDTGSLRMIVTRLRDGAVIFDVDTANLDLWRGTNASHFVRPKWGIYRSILDRDNLRPDEEMVRFANFSISKVRPNQERL